MRVLKTVLVLSTLVGAAACNEQPKPQTENLAWLDSLDLRTPPAQQAVVSPVELGTAATPEPAPQPVVTPVATEKASTAREHRTTTHRSSTHRSSRRSSGARHRSSGSYGDYSGSGEVYRAPRTVTVKHTKRDAAIGAGAGAVIGAVAGGGRHRVKGAVIGAAAGAIAGAVIGNNVDKQRRVQY